MTTTDSFVQGSRITSAERPSRRSTSGRVCRQDECCTQLSIYNGGTFCSLHAPMSVPRTRGKKLPAA